MTLFSRALYRVDRNDVIQYIIQKKKQYNF